MKKKLLTISFAAAISMFNSADAVNWAAERAEQKDLVMDRLAIKAVTSLAEFAALPADRTERLNQNFVEDAKRANKRLTELSQVQTLAGLLPLTWLPAALKSDLTTTNTRITSLSGAADLSQLLALDTSWLQPTLIQAIRRADIKLNHNLPDSLYENIDGIPGSNTIGVQIRTLRGASGQPGANDDVSKALEILYEIIVDQAHISSSDVTIDEYTLAGDGTDWYYALQNKIFPDVNSYTTENYLKFLSRILVDGKKTANDFSNIPEEVISEIVYDLGRMIDCATDEDLGIAIEEEEVNDAEE